jgi:AcrR family transcriptional regulator
MFKKYPDGKMQMSAKRKAQRELLLEAVERKIERDGFKELRIRELAAEVGIALGGVYNLVEDLDQLILLVSERTLGRMNEAMTASADEAAGPIDKLSAVAVTYCRFARKNLNLWRALFEHRIADGRDLPDWQRHAQLSAFQHVAGPLAQLMPGVDKDTVDLVARTLFAAVHGVVAIGLEGMLLAVPVAALERQVVLLVRASCAGLPGILGEVGATEGRPVQE